jgi:hypothetical protein
MIKTKAFFELGHLAGQCHRVGGLPSKTSIATGQPSAAQSRPEGQIAALGDRMRPWDGAEGAVMCSLTIVRVFRRYPRLRRHAPLVFRGADAYRTRMEWR